tara:strand:- start:1143 stop:2879 length:1737 start_codon:yes stop_codon:yes gene_type:complete
VKKVSHIQIIRKLFKLLSKRRKKVIFIFFLLSIIGAFAEVASISILIPFIDLVIDPAKIYNYLDKFDLQLNLEKYSDSSLLLLVTIIFISAIIFSSLIKFLLGYLGNIISNNITHELNLKMFKNLIFANTILNQKNDENNLNSSIIKMHSVMVLLQQFLSIVSNATILFFIILLLLNILNIYVMFVIALFGSLYFIITKFFRNKLSKNSKNISEGIANRTNILNNSIGLFKLIKVNNLERFFVSKFIKEDYKIAKSLTINSILMFSPGIFILGFTIISAALSLYILKINDYDLINNIPIFAALIFAIQKIIPLMQNIYAADAKSRANYFQSDSVINLISNQIKNKNKNKKFKEIKFLEKISYKNITFSYKNKKIIEKLNLELKKGDKILIKGKSGSGKTTLVNILLGILQPSHGNVNLNSKTFETKNFYNLRSLYSYTPQDIFIFNGTFNENISLEYSENHKNYQRVIDASKHAEIFKFINKQKQKFNAHTTYAARNISGGQKQRLGIARGLFKNKLIYIFDESTNSIDKITENKILDNITKYYKDKIIVFISHKEFKKNIFNKKYILKNKKLIKLND